MVFVLYDLYKCVYIRICQNIRKEVSLYHRGIYNQYKAFNNFIRCAENH